MAGPYARQVLATSPALYWRLNDPAGSSVVADSSGNGWTGTVGSGVTLGQPGALPADSSAGAAYFNNTANATIRSSYSPFVAGSQRTFMGWGNLSDFSTAAALFGSNDSDPYDAGLFVQTNQSVHWRAQGPNDLIWTNAWPE